MGGAEFTDSLGRLFLDPEDRLEFASISRLFEPFEFLSIFSDILSDNLSDSSLSDCPRLLADTDVLLLPPLDFWDLWDSFIDITNDKNSQKN